MEEIWKDIPELEGLYQASNLGRIRSVFVLKNNLISGTNYLAVSVGQRTVAVHTLVARTFIGPRPEGQQVNHIDSNRGNNNVANLEYLTPKGNLEHALKAKFKENFRATELKQILDWAFNEGADIQTMVDRLAKDGERSVITQKVRSIVETARQFKNPHIKTRYACITLADANRMRELRSQGVKISELAKMFNCDAGYASRISRGLMRVGVRPGIPKGEMPKRWRNRL